MRKLCASKVENHEVFPLAENNLIPFAVTVQSENNERNALFTNTGLSLRVVSVA